ncbi:hypothetical protein CSUI_007079, partial [Cystoisospora suis]
MSPPSPPSLLPVSEGRRRESTSSSSSSNTSATATTRGRRGEEEGEEEREREELEKGNGRSLPGGGFPSSPNFLTVGISSPGRSHLKDSHISPHNAGASSAATSATTTTTNGGENGKLTGLMSPVPEIRMAFRRARAEERLARAAKEREEVYKSRSETGRGGGGGRGSRSSSGPPRRGGRGEGGEEEEEEQEAEGDLQQEQEEEEREAESKKNSLLCRMQKYIQDRLQKLKTLQESGWNEIATHINKFSEAQEEAAKKRKNQAK